MSRVFRAPQTQAIRTFEDIGYFCIDNIPPEMVARFAQMCADTGSDLTDFCCVLDARSRSGFGNVFETVNELKTGFPEVKILYFDAEDATLCAVIKRPAAASALGRQRM